MDAIAGVTFAQPRLLLLLVPLLLAGVWLARRERVRRSLASRFVSERHRVPARWRALRPYVATAGLFLAVIALAGPQLGFTTRTIAALSRNRVFVLDVSNSMDARDIAPSRLAAAKAVLSRLLAAERGGRVGLVIFEKKAEAVAPLTTDTDAVLALLESVRSGETTEAGSDIGEAVRVALNTASVTTAESIEVVVVSDGEDQGNSIALAVSEAARRGIKVHTVMIGRSAPVPIPDGKGVLRDEKDNVVTTAADATTLRRLANESGGVFLDNPFGAGAIERLQTAPGGSRAAGDREVRVPRERYQWPLAVAFAAFIIAGALNRGAD